MSLFGAKTGSGLSISTTAANSFGSKPASTGNSLFGAGASQAQTGGGLFGSAPSSQPQNTSGLLGGSTQASQPAQTGTLFSNLGGASSQPQQGGGLFGSSTQSSQPAQTSTLFSNLGGASSQPQQGGGLFGNSTQASQPTQTSSIFSNPGSASSQPQQGGGLFGGSSQASLLAQSGGLFPGVGNPQPQQSSGLFGNPGNTQPQQSGGLFGSAGQASNTTCQSQPAGGMFGHPPNNTQKATNTWGLSVGQNIGGSGQSVNQASTGAKIDLEHLRTTTRYDQLTEDLQNGIATLDNFILNQMNMSHEVADLLPTIEAVGANMPNDVNYVSDRLEELDLGLENDATNINNLRDKVVAKDAAEAKLCFRGVDRLKMPAQYQQQQLYHSVNGTSSGGLSGWWNHPQTLQKSVRGATAAGGRRNLQLPGDDDEEAKGPSNLVEFFDKRAGEMSETFNGYKEIMHEIEAHLDGVELTMAMKQRELNDSRSSGGSVMGRGADEQIRNLRYALGVFERSIYDVADQVGNVRDGVQELVVGRPGAEGRFGHGTRLAR